MDKSTFEAVIKMIAQNNPSIARDLDKTTFEAVIKMIAQNDSNIAWEYSLDKIETIVKALDYFHANYQIIPRKRGFAVRFLGFKRTKVIKTISLSMHQEIWEWIEYQSNNDTPSKRIQDILETLYFIDKHNQNKQIP